MSNPEIIFYPDGQQIISVPSFADVHTPLAIIFTFGYEPGTTNAPVDGAPRQKDAHRVSSGDRTPRLLQAGQNNEKFLS